MSTNSNVDPLGDQWLCNCGHKKWWHKMGHAPECEKCSCEAYEPEPKDAPWERRCHEARFRVSSAQTRLSQARDELVAAENEHTNAVAALKKFEVARGS